MAESGILVMNKPQGFTSFDVIAKLRGILRTKRLGHTGTLDPMAEGVLPVLVGTATRACDILPNETKQYRAEFLLGVTTDTQDITGKTLKTQEVSVSGREIAENLSAFTGEILQIPPMYSAVRVGGKRLYELARDGKEVERPPRKVQVHSLRLLSYDPSNCRGTLEIVCGKGTYVRTLIHDLGERLQCGACMTALLRTAACGFTLAEAHSFPEVERAAALEQWEPLLIPADRLFADLPELKLNEKQTEQYRCGVKLPLIRLGIAEDAVRFRVYSKEGKFLGLARSDLSEGCLRIVKNL